MNIDIVSDGHTRRFEVQEIIVQPYEVYGRMLNNKIHKTYYDEWYGEDGTLFAIEPLAKTRDCEEYLLKAYPRFKHDPNFQEGYAAFYQRATITAQDIVFFGWYILLERLILAGEAFEKEFYACVKDAYPLSKDLELKNDSIGWPPSIQLEAKTL